VHVHHLLQARNPRVDQIIREVNHERRIPHHRPRAQYGVPKTQGCGLANVDAGRPARQNSAERLEQFLLALLLQDSFEFGIAVEVIARFELPVMNTRVSAPADSASSTAY
jgi:hypothetical protein